MSEFDYGHGRLNMLTYFISL